MDNAGRGQGELTHPDYCPGDGGCERESGDIVHTHTPDEFFAPESNPDSAVAFALVRNDDYGPDGRQRIAPQDVEMSFGDRRAILSLETFTALAECAAATVMLGHRAQQTQPPTEALRRLPAPIPRRGRHRR